VSLFTLNEASAFGQLTHDSLAISINLDQNGLATPELYTATAIRHLLGLLMPSDDLQPIAWDQFDRVAKEYDHAITERDPSGRQRLVFHAYLSGYFHELRHAHDLLGTVYGQEVLFQLLNCYQNAPALLGALASWQLKNPSRRVPIPLHKYVDELPDLPNEIVNLVRRYEEVYDSIRRFQAAPRAMYSLLDIVHLLETSATNTQLAFLNDIFGPEATFDLTSMIAESARSRLYLQARNEIRDIILSRRFVGANLSAVINYLVWCALMGMTPRGRKLSEGPSPVVVFEALIEHLLSTSREWDLESARAGVQDFCVTWDLHTPQEMRDRYADIMKKRAASFAASEGIGGERDLGVFGECYPAVIEAHERIQGLIESNSDLHFKGETYVWAVLAGNYPSVLLRVRHQGQVHDFVSRGEECLQPHQWVMMDLLSMAARMMIMGFGTTGDHPLEEHLFDLLTVDGWNGHRFQFEDRALF
jgi:hypothetical protein